MMSQATIQVVIKPIAHSDPTQSSAIAKSISGAADVIPVIQDITASSVNAQETTRQPDLETANAVPAVKIDQLVLSFTDDCWLEVTDAEDSVLATKLYRAGDRLILRGNAPFNIMLGNVKAAEVRFNGKVIAVTPLGSQRTLRFTVGNT
jgi:cytoskeleton protein RodZ